MASRNPGITPSSASGQRIKQMAQKQRVIGDSGRVRAAQQQGKANAANAQTRRVVRATADRMSSKLTQARALRSAGKLGRVAGLGAVAAAGINAGPVADGTLTAAMKRGDYKPKQGPAVPKRMTQGGMDKGSFNSAFKASRTAGKKTFSWRGKKYTTKKAGE